jgi:putative transcriptional regulator
MIARHIAAFACLALASLLLTANGSANAADPLDEPVILVAQPDLRDQMFGSSILIVTPIGNKQHIGFIINRPTPLKLSEMFPDHAPSRKVTQPVYLGGPENVEALFALVHRQGRSDAGAMRLGADLYLEIERDKVDSVIENEPNEARFFAGVVVWRPGELESELDDGFWYVLDADADVVLRKSTSGLWEELIKRIERNKRFIKTENIAVPPRAQLAVVNARTAAYRASSYLR